jgi:outer membrane receptor protein involved in Fe transport
LTSRRLDIGARAVIPMGDSGNVAARFAAAGNRRRREFGPGPMEDERTATGFLEVTGTTTAFDGILVLGSALQLDEFGNSLNQRYDHRWFTPSVFATAERAVGPVTLSLSARGDAHPEAGFQRTERVAALVRPVEDWSVRLSAGTGYAPPTAVTEETEAIGLRAIQAGPGLARERSIGTMLDINGKVANVEVLMTTYASMIDGAVQLADAGDGSGDGVLRNADGRTRIAGVEGAAIWRFADGKLLGTYGYARGSRSDANSGLREAIPLLPRHRVGADLMFEKENDYRVGIEGIFYGVQALDDNPFRSQSKPYVYTMAIAMKQFGSVEAVANFENLLDVRQTDSDPLVRPTPMTGGRWTTDVWAPLEGFMANVALRYRW